ncbi:conserved hypothetical protein [Shewanella sediminis HAW-EB3]|uniref:Uncharacterized protein n=1 Tax=Shewanella sediminis (strain HAW-EB3) TaxID=425104 RepID=A8FT88_SHESH|nr:hypothetical protein [Shewanella sediminis]ABV36061.1 conserved hypothetical protein [Shewanella sediminis HAW-EB3]
MRLSLQGDQKISIFQITAVFSMLFALVGFSYNVWRMEISEYNSNMRSASFELLLQLSELEGIVYAAHYDKDPVAGNPRRGWIKVNLIADLGMITEAKVEESAEQLKLAWQSNWQSMPDSESSAVAVVDAIDDTREEVRHLLSKLD